MRNTNLGQHDTHQHSDCHGNVLIDTTLANKDPLILVFLREADGHSLNPLKDQTDEITSFAHELSKSTLVNGLNRRLRLITTGFSNRVNALTYCEKFSRQHELPCPLYYLPKVPRQLYNAYDLPGSYLKKPSFASPQNNTTYFVVPENNRVIASVCNATALNIAELVKHFENSHSLYQSDHFNRRGLYPGSARW